MFGDGTKAAAAGLTAKNLTVEEFTAALTHLSGAGHYALGDCNVPTLPFGYRVHAGNAGAPNVWRRDGGDFVSTYTTDQFRMSHRCRRPR